jgi:hypothetical protein
MTTKLKELGITQNEYNNMLSIQKHKFGLSRRMNTALFNKNLATYNPAGPGTGLILTEKGKAILQKAN